MTAKKQLVLPLFLYAIGILVAKERPLDPVPFQLPTMEEAPLTVDLGPLYWDDVLENLGTTTLQHPNKPQDKIISTFLKQGAGRYRRSFTGSGGGRNGRTNLYGNRVFSFGDTPHKGMTRVFGVVPGHPVEIRAQLKTVKNYLSGVLATKESTLVYKINGSEIARADRSTGTITSTEVIVPTGNTLSLEIVMENTDDDYWSDEIEFVLLSATQTLPTCGLEVIKPTLSQSMVQNHCPSTALSLDGITASNIPAGSVISWHTALPADGYNQVTDTSSLNTGTYYAVFHRPTTACYGDMGTPVQVVINTCCDQPPFPVRETIASCGPYTLPSLAGGSYFGTSGGYDPIPVGTVITSNRTVYVRGTDTSTNSCTYEVPITITLNNMTAAMIQAPEPNCSEAPVPLNIISEATATGTLSHQWQSSANGVDFMDIANANSRSFSAVATENEVWYRRVDRSQIDGSTCEIASNAVALKKHTILKQSLIGGGKFCHGVELPPIVPQDPSLDEERQFQWQSSTDGEVFEDIENADQATFQPLLEIGTRWYRRVDNDTSKGNGCSITTDPIGYEVLAPLTMEPPKLLFLDCQAILVSIDLDKVQGGAQGDRNVSFYDNNNTPNDLTDDLLLQRGPDPSYEHSSGEAMGMRVSVTDGAGCVVLEHIVVDGTAELEPQVLIGGGAFCYGTELTAISPHNPSLDEGRQFQWQRSADGEVFEDIENADQASFTPGMEAGTTWYRRVDTNIETGDVCSIATDPVRYQIMDPMQIQEPPKLSFLDCQDVRVSIDPNTILGGSQGVAAISFYNNNHTPNDPSDDQLLQTGLEPSYLHSSRASVGIRISVMDKMGCEATEHVTVPATMGLEWTASIQEEICSGENDGSIQLTITGGIPPYTVSIEGVTDGFVSDQTVFENLEGGKSYPIHVKDSNGCTHTDVATLQPPVELFAEVAVAYYCEGRSGASNIVSVLLPERLKSEVRYTLDGDTSTTQETPEFRNLDAGAHYLVIDHRLGCSSNPIHFTVEDIGNLDFEVVSENLNQVNFLPSGGLAPYSYSVNGAAFSASDSLTLCESGDYEITIKDGLGCAYQKTVSLTYTPVKFPKFFSPNGDGTNDTWGPVNLDGNHQNWSVLVLDPYGRILARMGGNEVWDGNYAGQPLPSGDYWFLLETGESDGKGAPLHGNFTLYR